MSSDNFDNKIKESLEQRSPAYDEKAWDTMLLLLDKHLPQKKDDRRRIFFLLFLFLVLGGGSWLMLKNSSGGGKQISGNTSTSIEQGNNNGEKKSPPSIQLQTQNKEKTGNETSPSQQETGLSQQPGNTNQHTESVTPVKAIAEPRNEQQKSFVQNRLLLKATPEKQIVKNNTSTFPQYKTATAVTDNKTTTFPVSQQPDNLPVNSNNNAVIQNEKPNTAVTNTQPNQPVAEVRPAVTASDKTSNPTVAVQKKKTALPAGRENKNRNGFLSNLGFTFSAGPDVSMVRFNKIGQARLNYGAGLRYRISKKFSVRSGFYVSDKVYTTDPEDYNPPAGFWSYYPNIKKIDADCKIYEVPVNIDYNFSSGKKHNWFASAGISSLFMKKEEYNYLFKPLYSPNYVWYKQTHENENKHYFSVLSISSGYSRKISSSLTLQVEPYMKISLNGIGYGKVKLNSGGMLFTATVNPFNKKK